MEKRKSRPLVIDVEASGALKNKAHPFDLDNKLVLVGVYDGVDYSIYDIMCNSDSISNLVNRIIRQIGNNSCHIGFNYKFDMHWLRRYGIKSENAVWDCQLAEFILSKQQWRYPSLDEAAEKRGLGKKSNTLKEYLDKGIDVDQIPRDELIEYLKQDLKLTWDLYQIQKDLIRPYWPLFNVQCQDLKVLQEMEYNGMKYDLAKSYQKTLDCIEEEQACKALLKILQPEDYINWTSGYHLSAVLYGGVINEESREEIGTIKTGVKAGMPKYRTVVKEHLFPRLVEPLRGSELMKNGYFSTAEDTLRELKATGKAKAIIKAVLKLGEIEKIRSTYFEGIPKKFKANNWDDGTMHGNINQCVAITGRTSSSGPNLQNIPLDAKECFVSRFE